MSDKSKVYPAEVFWLAVAASEFPFESLLKYLDEFGEIRGIWDAPSSFLLDFLTPDQLRKYESFRINADLQTYLEQWNRIRAEGIELLPINHKDYPLRLKQIRGRHPNTPPVVLLRQGNHRGFDKCIAVVGTRRSSKLGITKAEEVGMELANTGFVVVSGLAKGIDAAAHQGCLTAGGKTMTRQIEVGAGYASQAMMLVHFGIGAADRIDGLEVTWPSNEVQRFESPALAGMINQVVTIKEGTGALIAQH